MSCGDSKYTVFDTIRMRGKTWQVAHELFLVMLRRIEDSGGKLNMVNCINDTHLNTVLEEAEVSAKRHTFRSSPRKGEDARSNVGRVAPKSRRVEGGLEKLPTDHE